MNWMDKLERKYGRLGINNLMIYIVLTMFCIYVLDYVMGVGISQLLYLDRNLLFQGQIWRLVTFLVLPPASSVLFVAISLYFYYWIGNTLENQWGTFQFNLYYLIGALGAIVAGLISGFGSNTYLNLSMFLAMAALFPDQTVLLFFIIPIKMRWLGIASWVMYGISLILAPWSQKVALVFSLINYFVFFGPTMIRQYKSRRQYDAVRKNFMQQMKNNQNRRF